MASVFRSNLFRGKVAVVSGGGTGIGRAIANELLGLGANVVIASRKLENLKATANALTSSLPADATNACIPIECNIRDEAQVQKLFVETVNRFGKCDFLVNNGGGQFPSPASQISSNGFRSVVDLNLNGTFLMCGSAFRDGRMSESGGAIVNIVCDMWNGFPGMVHTGAARAGVVNMTQTLATEWAPNNIRVNCVAPGVIFSASADSHYKNSTAVPDMLQSFVSRTPARRLGTVEEISSAVVWLLSPGAQYTSGATLKVDGAGSLTPGTYSGFKEHSGWPKFGGQGEEGERVA